MLVTSVRRCSDAMPFADWRGVLSTGRQQAGKPATCCLTPIRRWRSASFLVSPSKVRQTAATWVWTRARRCSIAASSSGVRASCLAAAHSRRAIRSSTSSIWVSLRALTCFQVWSVSDNTSLWSYQAQYNQNRLPCLANSSGFGDQGCQLADFSLAGRSSKL